MRLVVLALLAGLVLAGCGSAGKAGYGPVVFGRTGGNIRPFRRQIEPPSSLYRARLNGAFSRLKSRLCPGALPDLATEYISLGARTVRVRGGCEPAFTRLWNELSARR